MATQHTTVQKAFNAGYLLAKHLPALAQQIASGFKDAKHPYAEGFVAGSQQFEKEKVVIKTTFLDRLRQNFGPGEIGKPRGKEGKEKGFEKDI